MNREDLFNAITSYVRAAIDYEIASNQEGDDGYRATGYFERKVLDECEINLRKVIDNIDFTAI